MAWLIEYRDGFRATLFILNGFLSGMPMCLSLSFMNA
jgi:hypothetical protein|eukprot:COSAG06_NODE_3185_length_5718_cov_5.232960_6_plen_37_part_00